MGTGRRLSDTRGGPDIDFLERCVAVRRDRGKARGLFVKLWNREGTAEQAQRWLACLRELAPRYFDTHPGAYLQDRVAARPAYDTLRAHLGPQPSKEQLVALVGAMQERLRSGEKAGPSDEAVLWVLHESIPQLCVRYRPVGALPAGRTAADMVEEALAGRPLTFAL